ncbi:MAG: hypothetical protein QOE75_2158 [Solirubrobacterales bacterium]|jgi:hypothetical protein|nr:hypothetical protein [Solirubrobacterales bacterium]
MPRSTIRILGSQREALYEQVRNQAGAAARA